MMTSLFYIQIGIFAFAIIQLIRNQIVFKVRRKVDDEWVFKDVPDRFEWVRRMARRDRVLGSYGRMLWDWRKWTFRQFTKGLF